MFRFGATGKVIAFKVFDVMSQRDVCMRTRKAMQLAKQQCNSDYLMLAVGSLKKARDVSCAPIPILQLLLAQAEASLGYKGQWEHYLKLEWSSWPPDYCMWLQAKVFAANHPGYPLSMERALVTLGRPESIAKVCILIIPK